MKTCCTGFLCPISNTCRNMLNGIESVEADELGSWLRFRYSDGKCPGYSPAWTEEEKVSFEKIKETILASSYSEELKIELVSFLEKLKK